VTSDPAAAAPDEHDRLGAALRALADVVVRSGARAEDIEAAAAEAEALAAQLAAAPPNPRVHDSPYHPMSLVGGTAHPTAPQLHTSPTE
jgi:hypothetical protein